MLTHHALKMLKRRRGLTNARSVKLIEHWYYPLTDMKKGRPVGRPF